MSFFDRSDFWLTAINPFPDLYSWFLNYYIATDVYIFWRSDLPDITRKGHNVEIRSFASIWTFDVLIFCNAIGKFRTSKWILCQQTFRRSDFTYGVTKDQNVESLLCQKTFRCSDFTYGVEKDHYVESLFLMLFSTFWSS